MSDNIEILDDMTDLEYCQEEDTSLSKKYKNTTQSSVNEPFFKGSKVAREVLQTGSVILGFGICLHMASKFPSIKELIFFICLVGLVLIEVGKRYALEKINTIRITNSLYSRKRKLKATPYIVSSVIFIALSLGSGYFGSSEVIEYYSEHEPLTMLDSVKAKFNRQIALISTNFDSTSSSSFAMAAKLHEQSSWLGKTSREVRGQKADLVVLGAQTQSKKLDASVSIAKDMNTAVLDAKKKNDVIVKEHKEWCSSFAWWAVIAVLVFDGVLIVLSRWMANHEYRKINENKVKKEIKEGSKEATKGIVNQGGKEDSKDKDITLKDEEILEGSGGKADTITVRLKDGTLKNYTLGKFRNYFNQSSEDRQGQMQHYMDAVVSHEQTKRIKELQQN